VTHFKVLSQNFPEGTEEYHEDLSQDSWHPNRGSKRIPPKYKWNALSFHQIYSLICLSVRNDNPQDW